VKRRSRATMSDFVSDAKSSPAQQQQRRLPPGIHDGLLVDKVGVSHTLLERGMAPDTAVNHVKSGARVVFDECGCGGTCGFVYATPLDLPILTRNEPVLNTHKGLTGSLSLWRSQNGDTIVLAEGPVEWL
jgi:hypothetical protein